MPKLPQFPERYGHNNGKKLPIFNFDMGRKEYLDKMDDYGRTVNVDSIASDKNYFSTYYGINLNKYTEGKKFIIPYEMSDLFCLMMVLMKSSPTYDQRKKNISLEDIIERNKDVVDFLYNLPSELVNYIKDTSEYNKAINIINYLPIIIERLSALLHV